MGALEFGIQPQGNGFETLVFELQRPVGQCFLNDEHNVLIVPGFGQVTVNLAPVHGRHGGGNICIAGQ